MAGPRISAAGAPLDRPAPAAKRRRARPTETQCQATIVAAAKLTGWRVQHTRPARTDRGWRTPIQGHSGFPDLVLVHPVARRTLFVELKRRPRILEPEQAAWGEALISAGQIWRVVWVPEEMDRFVQELADLAVASRAVS